MRLASQWVMLRVRRYWLGRNPLRRRSDRLEAAGVALTLVLLLFSVWPAVVVGRSVYDRGLQAERATPGIRQSVTATLVRDAPYTLPAAGGEDGAEPGSHAPARWTAPSGERKTGEVAVPAGTRAGTSVKVWIDGHGELTTPPTSHAETLAGAVVAAFLVVVGSAATLTLAFRVFRWSLDRGRYAAWDASWAEACAR
ncbi:Rv1733c family protein [Nonomuraea jabiensis]|uniref:Rv1733c family protein n=1 Tax=Nonomuraea jabiensis TaxID=882448 RepID=UPI003D70F7C4